MDLQLLIAQWSGNLPPGFVRPAILETGLPRCREDRHIERARKRQDAIDAAVIDEFAAQPHRVHHAGNLDLGVSPLMPRSL